MWLVTYVIFCYVIFWDSPYDLPCLLTACIKNLSAQQGPLLTTHAHRMTLCKSLEGSCTTIDNDLKMVTHDGASGKAPPEGTLAYCAKEPIQDMSRIGKIAMGGAGMLRPTFNSSDIPLYIWASEPV